MIKNRAISVHKTKYFFAHNIYKMLLPELDFNYKYFIDGSTLLFGESKTGKSFIMVDILSQLQPHVDQIIVVSPTDRQNHTYDRGVVPIPCIHYQITSKLLDDIWERQNALAAVYTKANKPEILKSLFDRIKDSTKAAGIIAAVQQKLRDYRYELESEPDSKAKITTMEDECKKLISVIWRDTINNNRSVLQKLSLNKNEQFALKYLNLNPRLVLIFDDCTDMLAKFRRHPVMQKLFYQGRWAYITTLIACHTDKALDPELKKNAFISIFTEETCARSYFDRKSNDLDREAKQRAALACKSAFSPLAPYQKLIWVREEKKFYRYTASSHSNFRFGSQYVWEYCDKIKSDSGAINADNKFINDFK